jgi:hypothetical protein
MSFWIFISCIQNPSSTRAEIPTMYKRSYGWKFSGSLAGSPRILRVVWWFMMLRKKDAARRAKVWVAWAVSETMVPTFQRLKKTFLQYRLPSLIYIYLYIYGSRLFQVLFDTCQHVPIFAQLSPWFLHVSFTFLAAKISLEFWETDIGLLFFWLYSSGCQARQMHLLTAMYKNTQQISCIFQKNWTSMVFLQTCYILT